MDIVRLSFEQDLTRFVKYIKTKRKDEINDNGKVAKLATKHEKG